MHSGLGPGPGETAAVEPGRARGTEDGLAAQLARLADAVCQIAPARRQASPTVAEILDRFLAWADGYYRKAGRPTPEAMCLRPAFAAVRELCPGVPGDQFGIRELRAVREVLIARGLARTTINGYVARIVRAFRWAATELLVPAEVAMALRLLPGLRRGRSAAREPEPVLPVPWSQVAPALAFLRRQARGIVEVLWWTGARVNEICAMRHGDLDRSGAVWIYRVRDEANKLAHAGHARTIALGPRAQAALRPFIDRVPAPDPEAFVFSSAEAMAELEAERRAARTLPLWPSHDPAVRRARRGAKPRQLVRYTPTSLRRAIERACEQAGVEPWAPGRVRHSCATRLRGDLGDLQTVAAVLGHKDPSTTLIYAEADLRRAIDAAARFG